MKNGKVTISYITKPNGTEKTVVKKKPSWLKQTANKYGEKIKYVVTDDGVKEFTSFLAGFVPYAEDTIDIVDAATGKDIITGKKLKVDERAVTTLAALPVISGSMIRGGLDALKKIDPKKIKGLKKVKIVARHSDRVDDVADVGKKVSKTFNGTKKGRKKFVEISNPVLDNIRSGSALKGDALHAFNDIIDNYAGDATKFSLKGGDGLNRELYQIEGSLNGKKGIFEWIVAPDPTKGVTHRRFIENVGITGKPNARP